MDSEDAVHILEVFKEVRVIETQLLHKLQHYKDTYGEPIEQIEMNQRIIMNRIAELYRRHEKLLTR